MLRKPWKWRRRSPVVFAMQAETPLCSGKHTRALRHGFELEKGLPSYMVKENPLQSPSIVCGLHTATMSTDPTCQNLMRPNILSVNEKTQSRKKYVNSLHYSQISGLTPTSPFDINESH